MYVLCSFSILQLVLQQCFNWRQSVTRTAKKGKKNNMEERLKARDGGSKGFNVAHVETTGEQDVTTLSPASTPRVTDDPVGFSVERSVTDDDDGVVDLTGTVARVDSAPASFKVQ